MRHLKTPTVLLLLATTLWAFQSSTQQPSLDISILNVRKNGGKIVVALYQDDSATLTVPPGKYAVSVYQDVNENGKLDQNFLGIPKEPIGFGNNYRPLGKPDFDAALIEHTPTSKQEAIKLFTVF
jgi:uncharacterized protein (DUF2141 family)